LNASSFTVVNSGGLGGPRIGPTAVAAGTATIATASTAKNRNVFLIFILPFSPFVRSRLNICAGPGPSRKRTRGST
jgi:hypothetical protein